LITFSKPQTKINNGGGIQFIRKEPKTIMTLIFFQLLTLVIIETTISFRTHKLKINKGNSFSSIKVNENKIGCKTMLRFWDINFFVFFLAMISATTYSLHHRILGGMEESFQTNRMKIELQKQAGESKNQNYSNCAKNPENFLRC
jgi:hypothetical protein